MADNQALKARVQAFADRLAREDVNMHGFILSVNGVEKAKAYYAPFREGEPHRMYSVSKTMTALAVGLLTDAGKLRRGDGGHAGAGRLAGLWPARRRGQGGAVRPRPARAAGFPGFAWFPALPGDPASAPGSGVRPCAHAADGGVLPVPALRPGDLRRGPAAGGRIKPGLTGSAGAGETKNPPPRTGKDSGINSAIRPGTVFSGRLKG